MDDNKENDLVGMYKQVHATQSYGNTSVKNLRLLRPAIKLLKPASILDYGCGQSRLLDELKLGYPVELLRYDPAIPMHSSKPSNKVDLLLNIDVLEHIPEEQLDTIISEMAGFCKNAIIIVDMAPASKVLPNGQNAHCTLKPRDWWKKKLSVHFGRLYSFPTLRSSRAGFKTWKRSFSQQLPYLGMRLVETLRHYLFR